jgi:hypothetical protein
MEAPMEAPMEAHSHAGDAEAEGRRRPAPT